MHEQEKNQEALALRHTAEARDVGVETKEGREKAEAKKAGARERAEVVSKEVKNTKQQIQHIMANMQQVIAAVRAIREQLQLAKNGEDEAIPSVRRDEQRIVGLKNKLMDLKSQLGDLKIALLAEEINRLREENPDLAMAYAQKQAEESVDRIMATIEID
ncbi:MAG: hypothetical protein WCT40_04450 [Candidatus Magasanikbacteria bacterium]|jgi:hypothetical protein